MFRLCNSVSVYKIDYRSHRRYKETGKKNVLNSLSKIDENSSGDDDDRGLWGYVWNKLQKF